MTKDERLRRAARAEDLANDDFIRDAWKQLETRYLKELAQAAWDDDRKRLGCQIALQVLAEFQDQFISCIRDGKIIKKEIRFIEDTQRQAV
jgi:hypothetical protein